MEVRNTMDIIFRRMTQSPLALARVSLKVASKAVPRYSSKFSRKDFTQPQLFAILVLMKFEKTDYRGIAAKLADWSDLRRALKLSKVPHYSTLCYAHQRLLKKGALNAC